mmetsp:Transcript_13163/g.14821  ORF Transcript_13163/g.14821 Transcript_13163/m.14821 type:complete len:515 (+) Transcript_13163:84-1628(+)
MPKSASQIRRLVKRAQERGDTYVPPPVIPMIKDGSFSEEDERKAIIAKRLQDEFDKLEQNPDGLNAKDKRTAKRKAEAIALEEINQIAGDDSGDGDDDDNSKKSNKITNVQEVLDWYKKNQHQIIKIMKKKKKDNNQDEIISKADEMKLGVYKQYKQDLVIIDINQDLNAKDRRSMKRKAEAIACEKSKFESIQELITWYDSNPELQKKKDKKDNMNDKKSTNPYILFVGQIPYDTKEEDLFSHFQKYLGKKLITKESMTVRIPQHKEKSKDVKKISSQDNEIEHEENKDDLEQQTEGGKAKRQGRGFAFVEFNDPELMYECLKLHHTDLNGRRINVIRSAGGGKESRKEKFKERRKEQDEYISSTVEKIIKDYIDKGDLKEDELDSGAILLCKRRSAAIVEAALSEYIEQRGDRELENPSSFFSRVICTVTEEGEVGTEAYLKKKKLENAKEVQNKRRKLDHGKNKKQGGYVTGTSSILEKSGVDMSISKKGSEMSNIFPSMRGRGRGRGAYM